MKKGAALLTIIFMLAVISSLTALFVKIVYNCYSGTNAMLVREQSFYLAEAGLEKAKVEIGHNPNWYTDLPFHLQDNTEWLINYATGQSTDFGDGSFKIIREQGKERIYSIGSAKDGIVILKLSFNTTPSFESVRWKEI